MTDNGIVDFPWMLSAGVGDQGVDVLCGEVFGLFEPANDASVTLVDVRGMGEHLDGVAGDIGIDIALAFRVIDGQVPGPGDI